MKRHMSLPLRRTPREVSKKSVSAPVETSDEGVTETSLPTTQEKKTLKK